MSRKFSPAESIGGAGALKSIGGPLPQVTFCPTGGITPELAPGYLALANVACVGWVWVAPKALMQSALRTQIHGYCARRGRAVAVDRVWPRVSRAVSHCDTAPKLCWQLQHRQHVGQCKCRF